MTRHPLMGFQRKRQPSDNYDVWFALPYMEELEHEWADLMEAAQSGSSRFVPDDLCEELAGAINVLAKDPGVKPHGPTWLVFDEAVLPRDDPSDVPKFRATHVYESPLLAVWYVVFEEFHWVGICRLELAKGQGNVI